MFAVPGWSISAESLKTQTSGIDSVKTQKSTLNGTDGQHAGKKRKREGSKKRGQAVTSENFVELWEKVIEGKKSKQSKDDQGHDTSALSPTDGEATSSHEVSVGSKDRLESRKTLKQKKREKKVKANEEHDAGDVPQLDEKAASSHDVPLSVKDRFEARKALKQKKREQTARLQETGELPPNRSAASGGPTSAKPEDEVALHEKTRLSETRHLSKPAAPRMAPATSALTPLQAKMRSKLTSARFRHLNQTLYTTPSASSYSLFTENPDMFDDYHAGFRQQVDVWPENPVDGYIKELKIRGMVKPPGRRRDSKGSKADTVTEGGLPPLPRTEGVCVVADLGCGDAKIAHELRSQRKKLKLDIRSYDLGSSSELVTKADISALPLKDGSVDVAIFCLALMGTNWLDFIEEAYRVLRWKGELWIAEIKSRFGRVEKKGRVVHSVGNKRKPGKRAEPKDDEDVDAQLAVLVDGVQDEKGETDVSMFIEVLRKRGFVLKSEGAVDKSNKMFVKLSCFKALTPSKGKGIPLAKLGAAKDEITWKTKPKTKFLDEVKEEELDEKAVLKPCVYKLR